MSRLWTLIFAAPLLASPLPWSEGQPASQTGEILTVPAPQPLEIPESIAASIEGPTFAVYFSATCGHCKKAGPEIAELSKTLGEELRFLGVASANNSPGQIEEFKQAYGWDFPVLTDSDREFSRAIGAYSTPTVVVLRPAEGGGIELVDGWYPWFVGASSLFRIRMNPGNPFGHFEPGHYQGSGTCTACHSQEGQSWTLSHHATAYNTLYMRERTDEAKCVQCHVTGMGEPGGFVMGEHSSPMVGVGCESCHSAGGPHDGETVDAGAQCVQCHDADHSVDFSLEKGLPHIDHYLANTLSPHEQRERFQALVKGELERPLLAFPDGDYMGSESCMSCHEDAYKTWSKSPHHEAMGSLNESQRDQLECAQCHATSTTGKKAMALEELTRDEGVGCESCHGPGEDHIAAPSTDNIIGLGSSCPECIIEEICGSCHTPEWDPDWELHKNLRKLPHTKGRAERR